MDRSFRIISSDPSLARLLDLEDAWISPLPGEDVQALAKRALAPHSVALVDGGRALGGGDILSALALVEEIVFQGGARTPVLLASTIQLAHLQAMADLQAPASHPGVGFFQRLARSRCRWAKPGFLQVPCAPDEIQAAMVALGEWWSGSGEEIRGWRREIVHDALEAENRNIRHSLGESDGPRGAARLLLGAVASPASRLSAERCATALGAISPASGQAISQAMASDRYSSLLSALDTATAAPGRQDAYAVPKLHALLVDDDAGAAEAWARGIEVLLPTLRAGRKTLCGAATVTHILPGSVADAADEPDLVLLDYDLGAQGLVADVLARLKARWPFCPVAVFTRCDRVEIAQWSLRSGASAFFVKEPAEPDARRSDQHFDRFADLFLSLDGLNGHHRGLWTREHPVRRFCHQFRALKGVIRQWDTALRGAGRGCEAQEIAAALCMLLGTGMGYQPPGAGSIGGEWTQRRAAACANLLRAEELLQDAIALAAGLSPSKVFVVGSKPLTSATRRWDLLAQQHAIGMPARTLKKLTAPRPQWEAELGHPKYLASPMEPAQVAKVLARTGLALSAAAAATRTPSAAKIAPLRMETPPAPSVSDGRHDVTSRLGARELVQSLGRPGDVPGPMGGDLVAHLSGLIREGAGRDDLGDGGRLVGKRVWLVDDHPDSDYARCLEMLLRARGARVTRIGFRGSRLALVGIAAKGNARPDLVLVDLDMPDAEGITSSARGGLKAIETVRGCVSPAVPLAVLTGHTDSLHLGECLAAGAQDYIPRRHAFADAAAGRHELFGRIARLAAFAAYVEPLRGLCDDNANCDGSLQRLECLVQEVQYMEWPAEVVPAVRAWGHLHSGDEPGLALEPCRQSAWQAWHGFWAAAASSAPSDVRPLWREDAWLTPLLGMSSPRAASAAPAHARRAHVAIGNLFEPIVALLASAVAADIGQPPGIGLSGALPHLMEHVPAIRSRLAKMGRRPWAAKLEAWLRAAEDIYRTRSAWEHARGRGAGSETVPPAVAAETMRSSFSTAGHLLEAARALCERPRG